MTDCESDRYKSHHSDTACCSTVFLKPETHPQYSTQEEEDGEEQFIYHKYTYTSNFRLIHVSDGLPEKQ